MFDSYWDRFNGFYESLWKSWEWTFLCTVLTSALTTQSQFILNAFPDMTFMINIFCYVISFANEKILGVPLTS